MEGSGIADWGLLRGLSDESEDCVGGLANAAVGAAIGGDLADTVAAAGCIVDVLVIEVDLGDTGFGQGAEFAGLSSPVAIVLEKHKLGEVFVKLVYEPIEV